MAEIVTRISIGFSHQRQHPWPAWQRRHGWPPLNVRAKDPNFYFYVAGNKVTAGSRLGRLT